MKCKAPRRSENTVYCTKCERIRDRHRVFKDEPCVWDTGRKLCGWTGLAPSTLIENSKQADEKKQTNKKKDEYKEYNVISFGGGGAALDYSTMLQEPFEPLETEVEVLLPDGNTDSALDAKGGLELDLRGPAGVGVGLDTMHGYSRETVSTQTMVYTTEDKSHASFHLEDPDGGDYFVVQVFRDPYYGTPFFNTVAGASSCHHEAGTDPRSIATITAQYIGVGELDPEQPALFDVTISNELAYFESGQRANIDRPSWMYRDLGYTPPTMSLQRDAGSLTAGLQLFVDGAAFIADIVYGGFKKGSLHVLVEVHRGPQAYKYPAPKLIFGEACSTGTMDNHRSVELNMPGVDGGGIQFAEGCAAIKWTGELVASASFHVSRDDASHTVSFAVRTSGGSQWSEYSDRALEIYLEYRENGCLGGDCWKTGASVLAETTEPITYLTHGEDDTIAARWVDPETLADGLYDIRVSSRCNSLGGKVTSATTVITGLIGTDPSKTKTQELIHCILDHSKCPVDCEGQWGQWTTCSKTCGGGIQVRTYDVTVPKQQNGAACPASHGGTQSRLCNRHECQAISEARSGAEDEDEGSTDETEDSLSGEEDEESAEEGADLSSDSSKVEETEESEPAAGLSGDEAEEDEESTEENADASSGAEDEDEDSADETEDSVSGAEDEESAEERRRSLE
jgi:hypothetical protein